MDLLDITGRDTIVAAATPLAPSAIAIVRASGPQAIEMLEQLGFRPQDPGENKVSGCFYLGNIVDSAVNTVIDQVMAVVFRAPASYTGDNLVEVHCHGNPVIVDKIIEQFQVLGARPAEPGEFTRRAFLNGKMDLAQAEAVSDVIHAQSQLGVRKAQAQLSGRLSDRVRGVLSNLTDLRAVVEATIDFPEDDVEWLAAEKVAQDIHNMQGRLKKWVATFSTGRVLSEGARIVLVGPPNAGKSSLLNALLDSDRALVHELAGTTRDTIEEQVTWNGIPIVLVDTAGMRNLAEGAVGHEAIEAAGIAQAKVQLEQADVALVVVDVADPETPAKIAFLQGHLPDTVVVWGNKCDQKVCWSPAALQEMLQSRAVCCGSAQQQSGIDQLQEAVLGAIQAGAPSEVEGITISNRRHKAALDASITALTAAEHAVHAGHAPEFVAEDLRQASYHLGTIVGSVDVDELLQNIFSKFCIGK